ncbi:MAG: hypothetical protein HC922_05585 [Leptolyngbyaceae cyanobacterium SM2_3_12]|nr:hypothetical protein [Leptolyngbyaceae cyanobacterium SM2_3_12]
MAWPNRCVKPEDICWLRDGDPRRSADDGAEMAAIAEAEMALDAANAIKGAAVLDSLAFAETAEEVANLVADEAITSNITAETLRTLMAIGVIDDSEIETSILALVEAGLLSPDAVAEAISKADAAIAAVESAYAQG